MENISDHTLRNLGVSDKDLFFGKVKSAAPYLFYSWKMFSTFCKSISDPLRKSFGEMNPESRENASLL